MHERPTGASEPEPVKHGLPSGFNPFAEPGSHSHYRPNHFTVWQRVWRCALAGLLIAYGGFGVYANDLFIPGKRTPGVHLQGVPAWLMYGAFLSAACVLLALVVDHYDRRDNEEHYRVFKMAAGIVGWVFFGAVLLWPFLSPGTSTM